MPTPFHSPHKLGSVSGRSSLPSNFQQSLHFLKPGSPWDQCSLWFALPLLLCPNPADLHSGPPHAPSLPNPSPASPASLSLYTCPPFRSAVIRLPRLPLFAAVINRTAQTVTFLTFLQDLSPWLSYFSYLCQCYLARNSRWFIGTLPQCSWTTCPSNILSSTQLHLSPPPVILQSMSLPPPSISISPTTAWVPSSLPLVYSQLKGT